jgi:CheY-like chemotaxis protein
VQSILVLEDDINLRELIIEVLLEAEYEVAGASDAAQAIEMARKHRFQLLITDVRMAGGTDGVGALEAIKKFRPSMRCIVITGYASPDVPVRAMRLRADDYLLKGDSGFGMRRLLTVVQRVLEQPETAQAGVIPRLKAVLGLPLKAWLEARMPQLEFERGCFFDQLYVGLRPGHLDAEQGYRVWARAELLEERLRSLKDVREIAALRDGYRALSSHLLENAPLPALADDVTALPRALWQEFYSKIRQGAVSAAEFREAASLRLDPEARRQSASAYVLYCQLWGEPADPAPADAKVDARVGLSVGEFRICEALPGVADVERYRVTPGPKLLEIIPITPEAARVLAWERQCQNFVHGEKRSDGFYVVRDWSDKEQTLQSWIQPGGMAPAAAVARIKTLFAWVHRAHQQGLADGGLSCNRVHITAQGPVVANFGNSRILKHFVKHGQIDGGLQLVYLSTEVGRGEISAASDQYSLAVVVYQLLTGLKSFELIDFLTARLNGNPPPLPGAEPLTSVLLKMLADDPAQRYPDLATSWRALHEAAATAQG